MAYWSQKELEKRVAEKRAQFLAERSGLFKLFREQGWEISVLDPKFDRQWIRQADDYPFRDCHYLVKPPEAHMMRIRTIAQLLRLSRDWRAQKVIGGDYV